MDGTDDGSTLGCPDTDGVKLGTNDGNIDVEGLKLGLVVGACVGSGVGATTETTAGPKSEDSTESKTRSLIVVRTNKSNKRIVSKYSLMPLTGNTKKRAYT